MQTSWLGPVALKAGCFPIVSVGFHKVQLVQILDENNTADQWRGFSSNLSVYCVLSSAWSLLRCH